MAHKERPEGGNVTRIVPLTVLGGGQLMDAKAFGEALNAVSTQLKGPDKRDDALSAMATLFSSFSHQTLKEYVTSVKEAGQKADVVDALGHVKLAGTPLAKPLSRVLDAYCFGGQETAEKAYSALYAVTGKVIEWGLAEMTAEDKMKFLTENSLPTDTPDKTLVELVDTYMGPADYPKLTRAEKDRIDFAVDQNPAAVSLAATALSKLTEKGYFESDFGLAAVMPVDMQLNEDERELMKEMPLGVFSALGGDKEVVRERLREALVRRFGVFNRMQEGQYPSLTLDAKDQPILFVYGAVMDRTYVIGDEPTLRKFIETGIEDAAEKDGVSKAQVIAGIRDAVNADENPKLDSHTKVLGMLVRRITGKTGVDKIAFTPDEGAEGTPSKYEQWLDDIAKKSGIVFEDKAGGASINMAKANPRENIVVYTNRLHTEVAAKLAGDEFKNVSFMRIKADGSIEVKPISQAGDPDDPKEINRPFEVKKGIKLELEEGGEKLEVDTREEKLIYLTALPKDAPILRREEADKRGNERPLADAATLTEVGERFRVVMMNGNHYAKKMPGGEAQVAGQIRQMTAGGNDVMVAVELSSVKAVPKPSDAEAVDKFKKEMGYVAGVLDGVPSLSLNHEELGSVLTAVKYSLQDSNDGTTQQKGEKIEVEGSEKPGAIYKNAVSLAKALDVRRLHVHGQDFDLTLRRDAGPEDLQVEWLGQMYQKYGAIGRFMTHTGVKPGEPGEREPDFELAPNLKREGVKALMELALEMSRSEAVEGKDRDDFISHIIEDGYWHNPNGLSAVVNLPKWEYPGTPGFEFYSLGKTEAAVTGLGDTAGCLGAIGCMMAETPQRRREIAKAHGFD